MGAWGRRPKYPADGRSRARRWRVRKCNIRKSRAWWRSLPGLPFGPGPNKLLIFERAAGFGSIKRGDWRSTDRRMVAIDSGRPAFHTAGSFQGSRALRWTPEVRLGRITGTVEPLVNAVELGGPKSVRLRTLKNSARKLRITGPEDDFGRPRAGADNSTRAPEGSSRWQALSGRIPA